MAVAHLWCLVPDCAQELHREVGQLLPAWHRRGGGRGLAVVLLPLAQVRACEHGYACAALPHQRIFGSVCDLRGISDPKWVERGIGSPSAVSSMVRSHWARACAHLRGPAACLLIPHLLPQRNCIFGWLPLARKRAAACSGTARAGCSLDPCTAQPPLDPPPTDPRPTGPGNECFAVMSSLRTLRDERACERAHVVPARRCAAFDLCRGLPVLNAVWGSWRWLAPQHSPASRQ